jgi:hypothetical protein
MITQHLAPQTTPLNSCPQAHPKPNIVRDGSLPLRRVSCTVTPQTNPATSRPTHHPSRRPSRFKSLPREHYAPRPQATCIVYPHRTPSPLLASVRIPHAAANSLRHRSRPHRSQRTHRASAARQISTNTVICAIRPHVVHVAAAEEHVQELAGGFGASRHHRPPRWQCCLAVLCCVRHPTMYS